MAFLKSISSVANMYLPDAYNVIFRKIQMYFYTNIVRRVFMYKKLPIGILLTSIFFIGNDNVVVAENQNENPVKLSIPLSYDQMTYELSIPIGLPYYLPIKIDNKGNNIYKYKFDTKNPSGDWEINLSNGEIICGVEGTIRAEVYDGNNSLIHIYIITAGGM